MLQQFDDDDDDDDDDDLWMNKFYNVLVILFKNLLIFPGHLTLPPPYGWCY